MDPRKSKWTGWIEVGRNTLQIILSIIQLVPFISAATGIIFAYFSINKWAIIFLGMAILFFGVVYVTRNLLQERTPVFINPALWIEQDELAIKVCADKRIVERRYLFRALRKPIAIVSSFAGRVLRTCGWIWKPRTMP